MASVQCYKPAERTCSNKQHSLDQKVSETATWEIKKETSHNGLTETQTQCYRQTQAYYYDNSAGMEKSQVTHCSTQSAPASGTGSHNGHKAHVGLTSGHKAHGHAAATNSGMACQGKTSRWKKGLLQKIKDGISGQRDGCDGSSSSSSESDSENEKCGKRKASIITTLLA